MYWLGIDLAFQKFFSSHSQVHVLTLSAHFVLSYNTLSCRQTSRRTDQPCQSNVEFKDIQHHLFLYVEQPGSLEAP